MFARLGLKCTALRCRDRPDLELEVLPKLDEILHGITSAVYLRNPKLSVPRHFICPITQVTRVQHFNAWIDLGSLWLLLTKMKFWSRNWWRILLSLQMATPTSTSRSELGSRGTRYHMLFFSTEGSYRSTIPSLGVLMAKLLPAWLQCHCLFLMFVALDVMFQLLILSYMGS